jgi:hypothetical protein
MSERPGDRTGEKSLTGINCTNCGAALELFGGHRVKSLTCRYCGSVMDSHDGYKVITQYREIARPEAPLGIGMQAVLKEVAFTVIGLIEYRMIEEAELYGWVSFQLYSPTHGYAWLTWNDGHYVFSYRTRELPNPALPDHLRRKATVSALGRVFRRFEGYDAWIHYVEGELTWIAKRDDRTRAVEAIDPPFLFSYEQTDDELEYSIGEYLEPAAVHDAFGLDPPPRPVGIHPAQPFRPGGFLLGLKKAGPVFAFLGLLGFIFVGIAGGGRQILESTVDGRNASSLPFMLSRPNQLLKLELATPVSNSWVYYDITVAAEDEDVMALGKEISFYEGRDSGGYWSEGSTRATALFKLPAAGAYELQIDPVESEATPPSNLSVTMYEGVFVKRYVVALLVLGILATVALPLARQRFERRRWDEEEE